MENKEYFVPDLEDLFVGYECEGTFLDKEDWRPFKYTSLFTSYPKVRTPYLLKEDIEKEGWKVTFEQSHYVVAEKDGWVISLRTGKCPFIEIDHNEEITNSYIGECKSINEFRKLMKWLKIK